MPKIARKEITKDLAQLVGNPSDIEINPPGGKKDQRPYTRSGTGPDDQYTEIVTCRIDGQLKRLIEEEVQLLYPYYRTTSDFLRDALFKWGKYLAEEFLVPGNAAEPLVIQLDTISRLAWETEQKRNFLTMITSINQNIFDLLNDPDGLPKAAEEIAGYADKINDIDDTYWRSRTIREFVEMPVFPNVLRALKASPDYSSTALVKLLETWSTQRYVLRDK